MAAAHPTPLAVKQTGTGSSPPKKAPGTFQPGGSRSGCQVMPASEVTNRLEPTATRPALADQKSIPETPPATGCRRACQLAPPSMVRTSSPLAIANPTWLLTKSRSPAGVVTPSRSIQVRPPSLEGMSPVPAATARWGPATSIVETASPSDHDACNEPEMEADSGLQVRPRSPVRMAMTRPAPWTKPSPGEVNEAGVDGLTA